MLRNYYKYTSMYGFRYNYIKLCVKELCVYIFRMHGDRLNKKVFTYTDGDSFTFLEEFNPMTSNQNGESSILVEKMSKVKFSNTMKPPFNSGLRRRRLVIDKPTETVKRNHVITTPSKTMQIMLDLGVPDKNIEDERMICTVKVDLCLLKLLKVRKVELA